MNSTAERKGVLAGKRPWVRISNAVRTYRTWPQVVDSYRNWPLYFLDLFGVLRSKEVTYTLRGGTQIIARGGTSDRAVIDEVWTRNSYSIDARRIPQDAVVIDIGAHIGTFSLLVARLARWGRVYAYEPSPSSFGLLQRNLRINERANVTAYNLGVAGSPGYYPLASEGTAVASLFQPTSNPTIVQCISLEQIFSEHGLSRIHFLKCDCEGAEYAIFANCPAEYLRRIDRISLEYHLGNPEFSLTQLQAVLKSAGFNVHAVNQGMTGMVYALNRNLPEKNKAA